MAYSKEFKIGLLAVVALLILYFGFNFLKGQDFLSPTNSYYVFYKDVNGLTSSNQVLIDGYNVGMVGDMEIFQEGGTKILVELQIKKNVKIGKDARAILMDTDILGGKAIRVFPGDLSNPANPDDTLGGDVQKSLAEEFADRAMPVVQSFDSTILGINEFFKDYTTLSEKIEKAIQEFTLTMANTRQMIVENRANIRNSTAHMDSLLLELGKGAENLNSFTSKLDVVADSIDPQELASTLRAMRANLESMELVTQRMANGQGTLGKLSQDDSLYLNLNQAIMDLDSLLVDLKENPKRYVKLSLF